jgi:hypothetical protein
MQDYRPETYGDRIAAVYDSLYEEELDTDAAVEVLARTDASTDHVWVYGLAATG